MSNIELFRNTTIGHDADDEDNDDNEVKEDGIGIAVGERSGIRCR